MLGSNEEVRRAVNYYTMQALNKYLYDIGSSDKKNETEYIKEIIEYIKFMESEIIKIKSTNSNLDQKITTSTRLRAQSINYLFQGVVITMHIPEINQDKENLSYILKALLNIDTRAAIESEYLLSRYEKFYSINLNFQKDVESFLSNRLLHCSLKEFFLKKPDSLASSEFFLTFIKSMKFNIATFKEESANITLQPETSKLILEFMQDNINCLQEFDVLLKKLPIEELCTIYDVVDCEVLNRQFAEEMYRDYNVAQIVKPLFSLQSSNVETVTFLVRTN